MARYSDASVLAAAEHVAKSFGRRRVLVDVSFQLGRGEIVAITGENGSGKTTLFSILVGRLRADAGRIILDGRVGYCPQELLLFDGLTVDEHFRYFATAYGLGSEWRESVEEWGERFRFAQYRQTLVAQLSGGTKQKLNLALAFLPRPDLLILDEPYSGFDWETYLRFWDYADELRAAGRSAVLVSHFVYDRSKFDRVLDLRAGRLEREGSSCASST